MAPINRFINSDEGAEHLLGLSRQDYSKFEQRMTVKIYPGQSWSVFRYDDFSVNPIIMSKLKVINIGLNDGGVIAQFLDCRTNQLYTVGHVPTYACGYEIGVCFPQRSWIERTIKMAGANMKEAKPYYGLAASMMIIHRKPLARGAADVDYMDQWMSMRSRFTDEGKYEEAVEDYQKRCLI